MIEIISLEHADRLLEDCLEVLAVDWLRYDLVGSAAPRFLYVVDFDVSCTDHDTRLLDVVVRVKLAKMACRLVPIHERHIEVHKYQAVGTHTVTTRD